MRDENISITGYHGTLMSNAKNIRRFGFHKSNKEIEWLGSGVYFFEQFEYAKEWARQQIRNARSLNQPVVLTATISTSPSGVLDLDIPDVMKAFEGELQYIVENILSKGPGGAPEFNDDREARCFFCNFYAQAHKDVKVIAFSFPRRYYNDFGFPLVLYKRQLCVLDESCIKMPLDKLEAV